MEIPWENVLFYRHTRAASYIRATLHRYSAFAYVQRNVRLADLMIGAALHNVRQTGLEKQQAVQEKLAHLACYREGIHAHLTAAIALAEESPGGLLMPNQSLLYTGRVLASSQMPAAMHIARELCGGPDLRDARRGHVRRRRDRRRGWRSSIPSTSAGRPRTGAGCWPTRAICSTPTTPATG